MQPTTLSGRLTFAGSTTMQPLVEKLGEAYRATHPDVDLEIAAGGSVVGINAVQDGSADLGMVSREIHADEQQSGLHTSRIAIDVLAIIVHPSNPVQQLTRQQLQAIFTGQIANWREVGGADLAIRPIIREVSSGTRGAFDELVLKEQEVAATAETQVTAGEVQASVAHEPGAIGYVGFANLSSAVATVAIDGVLPTPQSAQRDEYHLKRPLILLTGPLSQPLAQSFVDFALSQEGQQIVTQDGWVTTIAP